jgi:hypothetical protein
MRTRQKVSIGLICSVMALQTGAYAASAHNSRSNVPLSSSKSSQDTSQHTDDSASNTETHTAKQSSHATNSHDSQSTSSTHVTSKTKSTPKKSWDDKQAEASKIEIPENVQEAAQHFDKTIEAHWESWTQGTGKLTIVQIGKLLDNPDITGKQAAALGALVDYFYKMHRKVTSIGTATTTDAFTLQELQDAMKDLSGNSRANEGLADDYRTALIQIKDDTTKDGFTLFGKKNPPEYGENVQWNVCDCYFVSAVNAMLRLDPDAIVKMIKQTGPDTFEVYFPGYKDGKQPVKVTLTQGDIAMFSHTRDGGSYLAVLGRATNEVMKLEGADSNKVANRTPIGTVVDEGSHWVEANTFHLLTGKKFEHIQLKDHTTAEVNEMIEYALKHNEFIGLGEGFSPISKHYLIITGIHDGIVDVYNPWGTTGWYAPEGNGALTFLPDTAKPTDQGPVFRLEKGHFQVALNDMVKDGFGGMTFQKKDLDAAKNPEKQTTTDKKDSSTDTQKITAPKTLEEAKKSFDTVVDSDWDKWTASTDGKLSIKEIGKLLKDPDITGAEAAALGSLALSLIKSEINPDHDPNATFTKEQITSMLKDSMAVTYYKDGMNQLQNDTAQKGISLYGHTGHPDWKKVKQWKDGDCWFVSVVDATLRKYGPDYVEKMIKQDPNDPNKFTVTFPGYDKPIQVTLTEGELAMFSHTVKDGSWLAVLGIALNDVIENEKAENGKENGYRSWYPLGQVINGGSNLITYKLFTNKTYTRISTDDTTELTAALKYAEEHHDPIGVNTHVHDLSIRKIDWKTGKVEIQNPWGTEQTYKTDTTTFKMGPDGTFWVPIADLKKDSFIKVEVPEAALEAVKNDAKKS